MTKNPAINAFTAALYIVAIASVMFYGPKFIEPVDSVLAPITILSLFVLSAAVMGFVFFYQPVSLYLENQKELAVTLLFKTVGIFAGITILFLIALFFFSGYLS